MQVLKNFNNISEELKNSIPHLKNGEVKTVQMLTGQRMLQVSEDGSQYFEDVFGKHQIPTRDRIKDPFFKRGGTTPEYVHIGVPLEVNANSEAVETTKFFMPGIGETQFLGKFSLIGGDLDDDELYEYLWLSNKNGSNPYRDKSEPPMYEFIDITKASKEKRKGANNKLTALSLATTMDLEDVRDFHASMGWSVLEDSDIMRANLEDYADKFTDEFLSRYSDPSTKVKSEVKRAIDAGYIKYDPTGHKLLWAKSDVVIAKLERVEGVEYLTQIAEWVMVSGKQGTNFRTALQKFLKELYAPKKEEITE